MKNYAQLTVLTVIGIVLTCVAEDSAPVVFSSPADGETQPGEPAPAGSAPEASDGETVDLRHHWKRPYNYGYGSSYQYGTQSLYPSYHQHNNYYYQQRPSTYNYVPSYQYQQPQQYYAPSYGNHQQYGYSNYYSSSYQQYSGGHSYGIGYREGNKDDQSTANQPETPLPVSETAGGGDAVQFQ